MFVWLSDCLILTLCPLWVFAFCESVPFVSLCPLWVFALCESLPVVTLCPLWVFSLIWVFAPFASLCPLLVFALCESFCPLWLYVGVSVWCLSLIIVYFCTDVPSCPQSPRDDSCLFLYRCARLSTISSCWGSFLWSLSVELEATKRWWRKWSYWCVHKFYLLINTSEPTGLQYLMNKIEEDFNCLPSIHSHLSSEVLIKR